MRQHRRRQRRTRSGKRTWAALAFAGVLIATLGACERPEPTQEAVLDEAYLVYPNATGIEEDFEQGTRGGLMNVDGGPPSPDPPHLSINYRLGRPAPPQDIVSWYEDKLQAEGWAIVSRDESFTHVRKEVGNIYHSIRISPLVPDTDSKHERYQFPADGEAATYYHVQYRIFYKS